MKMNIWIGNENKNVEFNNEVRFDGKRIFVDGELFSDLKDWNITSIVA